MGKIALLDQQTIDKIAAGEVIERPSSVVKELVENSIDAGASAVTVEIRDGGISFLRVTDNGSGIEKDQVPLAFLRHSTSKIRKVEDLFQVSSLGFRGEALSSIAAVAMVELITKAADADAGMRCCMEGGVQKKLEETAAPDGTTFLVRSLFYNTPARRKFLKSPMTEAGYISGLMERMALSHPEVSFQFINNGQTKLHTSGNHNLKDVIYHIYGREVAANLAEIDAVQGPVKITGFIGKPVISRGNRGYENYFINGRYIKSSLISRGIEEGYRTFMMQHKYPFTVLHFSMDGELLDVNVHPTKMELRFSNQEELYRLVRETVRRSLSGRELIPEIKLTEEAKEQDPKASAREPLSRRPEQPGLSRSERGTSSVSGTEMPFRPGRDTSSVSGTEMPFRPERGTSAVSGTEMPFRPERGSSSVSGTEMPFRPERGSSSVSGAPGFSRPESRASAPQKPEQTKAAPGSAPSSARTPQERNLEYFLAQMQKRVREEFEEKKRQKTEVLREEGSYGGKEIRETQPSEPKQESVPDLEPRQMELFEPGFLDPAAKSEIRIIGQLFDTYWLVQFEDKFYMIDQHAAHEKVLYERTVKALEEKEVTSQMVSPPLILTLTMQEAQRLEEYLDCFRRLGFEIEPFGGKDYAVSAVPGNLFGIAEKDLFLEVLGGLEQAGSRDSDLVMEKIASMSCKAAVKGNQHLSRAEAEALIQELLKLENPYNCPHGRPTIVSMTKQEIEKKFKRIV